MDVMQRVERVSLRHLTDLRLAQIGQREHSTGTALTENWAFLIPRSPEGTTFCRAFLLASSPDGTTFRRQRALHNENVFCDVEDWETGKDLF